ncbi:MAG: NHL repeat-containing protein [Rhodocyclaceae bacterium]
MGHIVESEILHLTRFGEIARPGDDTPGPVRPTLALNSPVGVCLDRCGNVWVCDTGNNRVLVFDAALSELRHVFYAPAEGKKGAGGVPFRMPFHVCPHPDQDRVFITDMGNSRVVVMDCAAGEGGDFAPPRFAYTIGDKAKGAFVPLQDPNGITLVRQADGSSHVFVNDEFFHNASEPLRNRCVRFDEKGNYLSEFRSVVVAGKRHDLYWPQGLSSDAEGNLYIANTGSYEILRCASDAAVDADFVVHEGRAVVAHRHGQPRGLGMLNIMRDVNVIGERVFVPDHVANAISVYHTDGRPLATVSGVRAGWHHGLEPMRSATDPMYYLLEDSALVSPYVICDGGEPDVYFISEPFTSRILKVRLDFDGSPEASVVMLAAVGGRRDARAKRSTAIGQFNCVTSVISLPATQAQPPERPTSVAAPDWLLWPAAASAALAGQYDFWWGGVARQLLEKSGAGEQLAAMRLTLDAGNWRLTGCRAEGDDYVAAGVRVDGWFLAGNLGMAVFTPDFPLLGQVVPGSPILLVGNFNMGTIAMYQIGPLGSLINYGVPFGMHGSAPGCIAGPQGMAASADGRVYIADTLNNRMSLWQILPSGTASFVRNFVWHDHGHPGAAPFTPTDAVLAGDGRLYVTDQFNNRICVFDHDGQPLFTFGKQGYWEEGEPDGERFMLPTSLAIDGDRLIVNDLVNRALKVFTLSDGMPRFDSGISLFKRTTEEGGVWMPFLMHAHEGRVYVADSTYNIVQVYRCQAG